LPVSLQIQKVEQAKDLDEVIIAHQAFLTELEEGCLLADTLWDKIKSLRFIFIFFAHFNRNFRSIFDQIVRFENIQKKLFDAIELESDTRESFSHLMKSSDFSKEDQMLENERRNTFKNEMFAYKVKPAKVFNINPFLKFLLKMYFSVL